MQAHCRVVVVSTPEERRRPTRPASFLERLDFHVHTGRQIELHQRVYGLLGGFEDVDQPLVRADLKCLARFFVDVRRTQHAILVLHRGQGNRTRNLCSGSLCRIYNLARRSVQHPIVIGFQPDAYSLSNHRYSIFLRAEDFFPSPLTLYAPQGAFRRARSCYWMMSVMVPAPTVRPPSRIANLRPFSIATGVCSSISSEMLSPGITISVPSGSFADPVTSVVRK